MGGEAVNGLDGCLVEFGDGGLDPAAVGFRQVLGQQVVFVVGMVGGEELFQTGADAFGEFGGGGFGEGDGDDVGHWDAGFDEGDDAADEGVGFASAGAGFDDEVGGEVVGDAAAGCGVVSGCGGHRSLIAALPPRAL